MRLTLKRRNTVKNAPLTVNDEKIPRAVFELGVVRERLHALVMETKLEIENLSACERLERRHKAGYLLPAVLRKIEAIADGEVVPDSVQPAADDSE